MALCDEMRLLLGPFDDGELEPHEMEEVAFHVVGCVGCKSALEDYRALGVALRDVVTVPALDNFAADIAARIDHTWVPLRARLAGLRDAFGHLGSVFEVVAVAAATAVITLIVAAPYARQFIVGSLPVPVSDRVAQTTVQPIAIAKLNSTSPVALSEKTAKGITAPETGDSARADSNDAAIHESQELVSQLGGGDSRSVAVWNEPHTGTTVVWVPDQP